MSFKHPYWAKLKQWACGDGVSVFINLMGMGRRKKRPSSRLVSCESLGASLSMLEDLLKHTWIILEAFLYLILNLLKACLMQVNIAWSILEACLKLTWSLLEAYLKPTSSLLEAFLKPSWRLLEVFLKPSWSLLEPNLKLNCHNPTTTFIFGMQPYINPTRWNIRLHTKN